MPKESKTQSGSSGKDKGKNVAASSSGRGRESKDREVAYHSSKGKEKAVVSSSSKTKQIAAQQQSQYGSSAPSAASYGAGTQFTDVDPQSYTPANDEGDETMNLDQGYAQYSSSAPGLDITYSNYATTQPQQYNYANTSDLNALASNFGTLGVTEEANQGDQYNTQNIQSRNLAGYQANYYTTNQGGNTGNASNSYSYQQQTPRQTGGPRSRGGDTRYQRDNNKKWRRPLSKKEFIQHDSKEFWIGRVVKLFWFEPPGGNSPEGGENDSSANDAATLRNHYGLPGKIRRFVIVKNRKGHCIGVPINTYGFRGCTKPGCHKEDHAMIYTDVEKPYLTGEGELVNPKIRMNAVPGESLDKASRINYAKVYTIEHNFNVSFIGNIANEAWDTFWLSYERVTENPSAEAPTTSPYPVPV